MESKNPCAQSLIQAYEPKFALLLGYSIVARLLSGCHVHDGHSFLLGSDCYCNWFNPGSSQLTS